MNKLWLDHYDYNSQVQCTILPHEEIDRYHYHLLIETIDANLSLGMRQLNGMYIQLLME